MNVLAVLARYPQATDRQTAGPWTDGQNNNIVTTPAGRICAAATAAICHKATNMQPDAGILKHVHPVRESTLERFNGFSLTATKDAASYFSFPLSFLPKPAPAKKRKQKTT